MMKHPIERLEGKVNKILAMIYDMGQVNIHITDQQWDKIDHAIKRASGAARDNLTQDTTANFKLE